MKRQREQQRRERAQAKAEKRQQRKQDKEAGIITDDDMMDAPVMEEDLSTAT